MLGRRFDDPNVGLVWNEQVDVLAGETRAIEGAVAGFGHRAHGVLEHFAAGHLHVRRAILEHLVTERRRGAAGGAPEQLRQRTIAAHEGRQDAARAITAAHDRGARTVAEEHCGAAILPIDDRAHLLGAHDERRLDGAGRNQSFRDGQPVQPPATGGRHVEGRGARRTKGRLHVDGGGRQQPVRRGRGDDDRVDLGGGDAGFQHRLA